SSESVGVLVGLIKSGRIPSQTINTTWRSEADAACRQPMTEKQKTTVEKYLRIECAVCRDRAPVQSQIPAVTKMLPAQKRRAARTPVKPFHFVRFVVFSGAFCVNLNACVIMTAFRF